MKVEKLVKSAGIVSLGTLFSRITGLIRLQIIAYLFGYSQATDAFWLAFTLPNLLRALLAEGALSTAFIPVFSEWYSRKGEEEAWRLANNILNLVVVGVSFIVVIGMIFAPLYVPYFGLGFRGNPDQMKLAISLTRFMWPFLLFISVAALFMAILNCRGHFASPAFAPLFFNLSFIFCALIFAGDLGIYSLALGVVLGGAVQLFIQLPSLIKRGFRYRMIISLKEKGVRKIFKLVLPAILGAITLQLSVVVTRIFASTLPPGGISGLQYAMRLIQFPLGLFPIAISTVFFPRFSSIVAAQDHHSLKEMVSIGMRMVFFLLVPSSVGLIMLREDIVGLLFQHGVFTFQDTLITSEALFYYSLGLFAMGGVMILTRAFYSLQDMLTPLKIFLICFSVNLLLNFLLIAPLQHKGLALATSLSIILNMGILASLLRKKLGGIGGYSILLSFVRVCLMSALMGGGIYLMVSFFARLDPAASFIYTVGVVFSIITGMGIIAGLSYLMRLEEFKVLIEALRRR